MMSELDRKLREIAPPRENLPRHVAVIMDGNGRWAKMRSRPRVFGHHRGAENVRKVVQAAGNWGIDVLTLFAFSEENWGRPTSEVAAIMRLLETYLERNRQELYRNNVRLVSIGDLERLTPSTRSKIRETEDFLSSRTGLTLNIAVSYGGQSEIVRACQNIAAKVQNGLLSPEDIDRDCVANHLDTAGLPDPDLLIRTSGELRISNFLLWQLSYAELYFTPVLWPDFDELEFAKAIVEFQSRCRRFGILKPGVTSKKVTAGMPANISTGERSMVDMVVGDLLGVRRPINLN